MKLGATYVHRSARDDTDTGIHGDEIESTRVDLAVGPICGWQPDNKVAEGWRVDSNDVISPLSILLFHRGGDRKSMHLPTIYSCPWQVSMRTAGAVPQLPMSK